MDLRTTCFSPDKNTNNQLIDYQNVHFPVTAALTLIAVLRFNLPVEPVLMLLTTQDDIKQKSYSAEHMLVMAATAKCISLS